ncbi:Orc1/cdc6 family replication initiation protein [Halapricum desulfuricans]|uniref:Orc1/cdc6 family replication initiation protein n=1 Tax=Halapricum desulfuricans TaxID=2841257 RepID=A0A897NK76_9EURY|nr:AAA family ATPase [Halapricum desulfuricans]QSG11269.1 Orc1/cdc6 family replication initiation protein [Halapricum desulfuricans]
MDLAQRIRRRRRRGADRPIVLDYEPLNPVAHVQEPVGRGPIFERLLDHLDPVFDGTLPPNVYVWGPPGSGKSAIVTALFDRLKSMTVQPHAVIHTSTRAQTTELPTFVYVDTRTANSEFQLYHRALQAVSKGDVPRQGVSTAELRSRLNEAISGGPGVVLAVDHVGESESLLIEDVTGWFEPFGRSVSLVLVGRPPDSDSEKWTDAEIEIPGYGQQVLIDILMTRGSDALARDALQHSQARQIASWAGGDAHDALAALFGGADQADAAGVEHVRDKDIQAGIDAVPTPCVPLGVVLSLRDNRQRVLRELLDLGSEDRGSVTATTEAIAAIDDIDLSPGTVKRFLYELAERGVVERVSSSRTKGHGRPPSRVEPRFPTLVFRRLYDLQTSQR